MYKNQAKYSSIADDIAKLVARGEIKVGEKVPSENDIIARYGVSNTTARKALSYLENRGIVCRVKGKGTVVIDSGEVLTRALGSFKAIAGSFDGNLKRDGYAPDTTPPKKNSINGKVSIQVGGNFYEIVGKYLKVRTLRRATKGAENGGGSGGDSILLKDEIYYFNEKFLKGIESENSFDSIVPLLRDKFGAMVARVDRSLSARISGGKTADLFGRSQPLFCMEGAFLDSSGRVLAIEKSLYNARRYKFTIESTAE